MTGGAAGAEAQGSPTATRSDYLLLALLGVIWGSAFPVIRWGLLSGAPILAFAGLRLVLAAAGAALLALLLRERLPDRRRLAISTILGGITVVGAYAAFLYLGEGSVPGGLSAVIVASAPIWSAIIAIPFLPGEGFGVRGALGLGLGFGGVAVLFLPDLLSPGHVGILGAALVLAAALSFAVGSVATRRLLKGPQGSWEVSGQFLVAGALLYGLAGVSGEGVVVPCTGTVGLSLLYLAAVSSVLGMTIYLRLHHRIGPSRANLVAYVNPLAGIAVGILLLGESLTLSELGGLLLIVSGLGLLRSDPGSAPRAPRDAALPAAEPGPTAVGK